ncbi:hypothetical protein IMG5_107410 [Ichthyophthirius multifiliis]|uniref:Uncharacterized protein n=1 Tax=Ichthyophthirius multifiliis TaxID=5932 RepID=G0QTE5_ICHMU|nr:hypothetical protein IMG5_107410 [Ichthyophthirius multifiliis]EGR31522.1 hypothetical protein IMG5_107410 [Ichthyophthirius multifiliis]|eukprot:XP_004035008.1 hypothetical protein IMG5_107410 [Ichthyophthirius multifiliis]
MVKLNGNFFTFLFLCINQHVKTVQLNSKRKGNLPQYIYFCDERDQIDQVYDKVIKNKYFGIKGVLSKPEMDRIKCSFTPLKQEKYELGIEWEQKPKKVKIQLELGLPYQKIDYKVYFLNEKNKKELAVEKQAELEFSYQNFMDEFEIDVYDLYFSLFIEVRAYDQNNTVAVNYNKEYILSTFEKEMKVYVNEMYIQLHDNEQWKIQIKQNENLQWNPYFRIIKKKEDKSIDFVCDINKKDMKGNLYAELNVQEDSYEFIVCKNHKIKELIYIFVIECDGFENEMTKLEHKIFINGKGSSKITNQSFSFGNIDSNNVRKEKPSWLLGYIKDNVFNKINTFMAKRELNEFIKNEINSS